MSGYKLREREGERVRVTGDRDVTKGEDVRNTTCRYRDEGGDVEEECK